MQFSSRSIHSYLPDSTAIISVILVIAASNSILVTNAMALPTTNESEKLFLVISKPQVDVDEDGFQEVKRNPVVVFPVREVLAGPRKSHRGHSASPQQVFLIYAII